MFRQVGLTAGDKNSGVNGLFLAQNMEKAFDMKRLCFVPNPLNAEQLICQILDKNGLKNTPLFDSYKKKGGKIKPQSTKHVGDFHNYALDTPREKICFRIFSRHAFFCHRNAVKNGWLTYTEKLFSDFSSPLLKKSLL